MGERNGRDKGDLTNLIISGGSCDQGLTPVEDLPLFEGSGEFGVLSIDCLCHGRARRWSRPRLTHDASTTPHSAPLKSPIQFQPLCHILLFIYNTILVRGYLHLHKGEHKSMAPGLSQRLTVWVIKSWSRRSCKACCVERLEAIECPPPG